MAAITEELLKQGITGIFILLLVFAIRKIFMQVTEQINDMRKYMETKEEENKGLETSFRSYLIDTQKKHLQIIDENTKAFREYAKHIERSNEVNERVLDELKRREYIFDYHKENIRK